MWVYDPAAAQWREATSNGTKPAARFGHDAVYDAPRKHLVVTLEQAGPNFFNDVWALDPADRL